MFTIERHQEIMNILKTQKSVSVTQLSQKFYTSEATIRRDLEKLEKMGILKRTYGGAVLLEGLDSEIPLSVRESEQKEAKDIIGKISAQLVQDNNIIIMDSSSTTLKMVPYLKGKEKLTVLTNGAKTAIDLGELLHITVYSTGGVLRENSLSYIGDFAQKFIQNFYADIAFFSCRGLSMERGLSDSSEQEAVLRKVMMKNARKSVLLCDHTKFDTVSFCRIGDFEYLDYLITDQKPSSEWIEFLQKCNVQLLYNT